MVRRAGYDDHFRFNGTEWVCAIDNTIVQKITATETVVSGNLLITGTTTVQSVSGSVHLSASTGNNVSVTGSMVVTDNLDVNGYIDNTAGHVVVTSSAGSVVTVSGNVNLAGADNKITGKTGHVVLSSSVGSVVTVSGGLKVDEDVNAAGGFRSQLFFRQKPLQGVPLAMSSSLCTNELSLSKYPMASAGSVIGLSLYSADSAIDSGALTASLTIDGVKSTDVQLIMTTGSAAAATLVAKDTATFSASQQLGVVVTASADYVSDLATSGSFVASLFVEL